MNETWLKITKIDESYGHITSNHPSIMGDLYSFFSHFVDGYYFMPKFKAGVWDGKVHFMERSGKIPIGLIHLACKFVKQDGMKIFLDPSFVEKYDALPDFEDHTNKWLSEVYTPYSYQFDGALIALKYNRCILEHATGAGKSLTMALIIMYNLQKARAKKILILVPGISLVHQLASDFIDYGIPPEWIGKYYADQKDTNEKIIISTWQSLKNNADLASEFDMLIADEVHSIKGHEIKKVVDNCRNAKYRIGLTGTMPDKKTDNMSVLGSIGPILHKISSKNLIEMGTTSDIIIKIPFLEYAPEIKSKVRGLPLPDEKEWLENYDPRNNIIKKIISKHVEKGHNCLILVDHISHGEKLFEKVSEIENCKPFFIRGETAGEERERIRGYTNENEGVVIVATYGVFSTGVSIKRLHTVLFASAGKSKIRTLQSIGRGLRLHKDKKHLILYDIGDSTTYAEKHLENRIQIYTKAQFNIDCFEIKVKNG